MRKYNVEQDGCEFMRSRPTYCCKRATQPPPLDGIVSDTIWADTESMGSAFHLIGGAGRSAHFLEAAALWDDDVFYVSYVSDPSPVPVTKKDRDDDLFNECAVEIFLRAGNGYYEIEVNPLGVVLDLYFPNVEEEDWREMAKYDVPGLQWIVKSMDDRGRWCTQIAIPWAGVPEVSRAEYEGNPCVFGNFARSQTLPDGSYDLTTWSPAEKAFCELDKMGCIILSS